MYNLPSCQTKKTTFLFRIIIRSFLLLISFMLMSGVLFIHYMLKDRYIYILTIMDDCSRYTWVYLLQTKAGVQRVIPILFLSWLRHNLGKISRVFVLIMLKNWISLFSINLKVLYITIIMWSDPNKTQLLKGSINTF